MMSMIRMISAVDPAAERPASTPMITPTVMPMSSETTPTMQRLAGPVDHPAELVAAEVVEAEPVVGRGPRDVGRCDDALAGACPSARTGR